MSHEARPISPVSFAHALEDLPISNLYAKVFEINNSISHLESSNAQLQEYSDSQPNGDSDCLEAIRENVVVIVRMIERIEMVKSEVERRGGRWHEAGSDGDGAKANGTAIGAVDGDEEQDEEMTHTRGTAQAEGLRAADATGPRPGGRLDENDLRRQLAERMAEDEDEGMHL